MTPLFERQRQPHGTSTRQTSNYFSFDISHTNCERKQNKRIRISQFIEGIVLEFSAIEQINENQWFDKMFSDQKIWTF